jgi:hypothetical protein
MNKMNVNIPAHNWNPVSALSNKLNKGASSLNSKGASFIGMAHAEKMQGKQHEHEKNMQSSQQGHEIHSIIAQGAVDMENNAANNRHERRQAVLTHNQGMEKMAQEHHNATGFMETLRSHAEPGTEASFGHGNINASFTLKNKKTKAAKQEASVESTPATPAPSAPASTSVVDRDARGRAVSKDPVKRAAAEAKAKASTKKPSTKRKK